MAVVVAATIMGATFLPMDAPEVDAAFGWRASQRVIGMESWQREEWPTLSDEHDHLRVRPSSPERWRSLVAAHFRAEDVDRALCLMGYESAGNPTAQNPKSTATGLFQIMHSVWADTFGVVERSEWHDPVLNVRAASVIRDVQGWTAWAPYNRGLCR